MRWGNVGAALLALAVAGCPMQFGALERYTAAYEVTGDAPIPRTSLGEVPLPENGQAFANVVVFLLRPELAHRAKAGGCAFETDKHSVDLVSRVITVTGRAVCTRKGEILREELVLSLTPVAVPTPAP